ncbi:hypothetical protein, partial [Bradyrhizobium ottawaense]|uniref:hypothetical protein n=1 Tax=Bradyrhizobium ottawaense TaxID=931866 RepID=UPI0030C6C1CE
MQNRLGSVGAYRRCRADLLEELGDVIVGNFGSDSPLPLRPGLFEVTFVILPAGFADLGVLVQIELGELIERQPVSLRPIRSLLRGGVGAIGYVPEQDLGLRSG